MWKSKGVSPSRPSPPRLRTTAIGNVAGLSRVAFPPRSLLYTAAQTYSTSWDDLVAWSYSLWLKWYLLGLFPSPPPYHLVCLRWSQNCARSHTGWRTGRRVSAGSWDLSSTSLYNESQGSSECLGLCFQGTRWPGGSDEAVSLSL